MGVLVCGRVFGNAESILKIMTLLKKRYIAPLLWLVTFTIALGASIINILYSDSIPVQVLGILTASVSVLGVFIGVSAIRIGLKIK